MHLFNFSNAALGGAGSDGCGHRPRLLLAAPPGTAARGAPSSGWASCRSWSSQGMRSPSWRTVPRSRARPGGGRWRRQAMLGRRAGTPDQAPPRPLPLPGRRQQQHQAGGLLPGPQACAAHLLRLGQRQLLHRHLAAAGGGHHPAARRGAARRAELSVGGFPSAGARAGEQAGALPHVAKGRERWGQAAHLFIQPKVSSVNHVHFSGLIFRRREERGSSEAPILVRACVCEAPGTDCTTWDWWPAAEKA